MDVAETNRQQEDLVGLESVAQVLASAKGTGALDFNLEGDLSLTGIDGLEVVVGPRIDNSRSLKALYLT